MDFIGQLWLPILVASAFCFIASAILWMMGPHHKGDWKAAPNQDGIMAALRQGNVPEGAYILPHADMRDKAALEAAAKQREEGPSGILYVGPRGRMNMGAMMTKQLVFFIVANFFLAYVTSHALPVGTPYIHVFRIVGAIGFMMYSLGAAPESIWFGRPWRHFFTNGFDGLVYALLTAGTFGWLWPK